MKHLFKQIKTSVFLIFTFFGTWIGAAIIMWFVVVVLQSLADNILNKF